MTLRSIKRYLIPAISGLALLGLLAFVVWRWGPLAPVKVTVVRVQEGQFAPELFGIGTVEARRSWSIGPTAAGRVAHVLVDVGDTVRAGQLLADMDPVDLDQRLASQTAAVERAKRALTAAAATQTDAQAKRDLAASNLRRNQELADQHFISPTALEGLTQAKVSAEAVVASAAANQAIAEQDLQRAVADRAALQQQRTNVRLVAAADAVVVARDAEPGSTVVAGQSVLRLIDPQSLWVRLRLDQGRSAGLSVGLKARIVLRSQPQATLMGTVSRLEWLSDSVAEERMADLTFDQRPSDVSVGEMAEASLLLPTIARSTIVPAASLVRQGGKTGVWLLRSGKPVFTEVKPGASSPDGRLQILAGLSTDDEVVVYSNKPLRPGMRVQVVQALGPSGAVGGAGP